MSKALEAAARAMCFFEESKLYDGCTEQYVWDAQDQAMKTYWNKHAEVGMRAYLRAVAEDEEAMLLLMRAMRDAVDADHAEAWYEIEARAALRELEPGE